MSSAAGRAKSFRAAHVTADVLHPAVRRYVDGNAKLMTDEHTVYRGLTDFDHQTVNHGRGEYVRGDVTTNTVEGYFANLKRGLDGVYHHVSEAHLGRYLAEFDYLYSTRYSTDSERTVKALGQAEGKRLTCRATQAQLRK